MTQAFVPQAPIITFLDGHEFEVLRIVEETIAGKTNVTLSMSPFDHTSRALKLEDVLDFSEFTYGVVTRTYPRSHLARISDNPEKPKFLMLLDYAGTLGKKSSNEIINKMLDAASENDALKGEIKVLKARIEKLEEDLYHATIRHREYSETQKGGKERAVFPVGGESQTEIKMTDKANS